MSIATLTAPTIKDQVQAVIEERSGEFVRLAHDIQARPELAFHETYAATRISGLLAEDGFAVQFGLFGLPTAFDASIGNGPLHVAFCAEYRAHDDRIGHGLGHNLIAGAAVAAAIGLHVVVDEVGLTVSVIGTRAGELIQLKEPPARHLADARINPLEASPSSDVHAVLMVHAAASPRSGLLPIRNDLMLAAAYRRNAEVLGNTLDVDVSIRDQIRGHWTLFPRRTMYQADLGSLSDIIPSIYPTIGIGGTPPNNIAEFTRRADTDEAYRAMLDGGVALAWTALDAATDPAVRSHLLERATLRWSS